MTQLKKNLEEDGFCLIPKSFSSSYVQGLIDAVERTLENENFSYDFLKLDKTKHTYKIKYMFEKDEFFYKTLVSDPLLSIILDLIDDPQSVVPTWEDMLIKAPSAGIPVTVHQDIDLLSTLNNVFIIGIYMHDACHNPVHYLPGSHNLGALKREEIYEIYHLNKDNFVPLNAKAGDISIHNVKTIHFSEKNKSKNPRYTWYLEFRTKDQLIKDSPWDIEWISARRAIWVNALRTYKKNIEHLIPDEEELKPYINPLRLRVLHTNEKIKYDLNSPYNHFERAPSSEDVE
jgi:hypothetical protein